MTKIRTLIAIMAVASIATSLSGQAATESAALQRLNTLLQRFTTLEANVTQLIIESDGGILEESEIRMALKKPNGFYWETLSPFPELLVTNGEKLWNYVPDLEQVVVEDWDGSRNELAAQLLNGQTDNLAQEYTIELATEPGSEYQEFELTPIATDSVYQQISINFMNDELDTIYLASKNGQKTVWRFEDIVINHVIADGMFEFQPPDNIEIIENSYTQ